MVFYDYGNAIVQIFVCIPVENDFNTSKVRYGALRFHPSTFRCLVPTSQRYTFAWFACALSLNTCENRTVCNIFWNLSSCSISYIVKLNQTFFIFCTVVNIPTQLTLLTAKFKVGYGVN